MFIKNVNFAFFFSLFWEYFVKYIHFTLNFSNAAHGVAAVGSGMKPKPGSINIEHNLLVITLLFQCIGENNGM